MLYMPLIFLAIFLLLIITRPFTVLLHELGHAIPVILATKQPATIYVGSYGDQKYSFKLHVGKLDIWFRYNPFKWHGGLCIPEASDISVNKQILYIVSGPLFSLFIAVILCIITFVYDLHGSLKLICLFAAGSTLLDLFGNLAPRQIIFKDGVEMYSDGYHILRLWALKQFPARYADAIKKYNKKEYAKAAVQFETFIQQQLVNEDIYRLAATSYLLTGKYEKAFTLFKEFELNYPLDADDYYHFAISCNQLNLEEEKNLYYKKAIEINPEHAFALNNIGYDLNKKREFGKAIVFFDRAIKKEKDFAYAYNNRGHAKIETGQLEEGLRDIQHALLLNKENAYAYRNLGIYYLLKKDHKTALNNFYQAKQMDKDTDMIDELIGKANQILQKDNLNS